MSQSRSVPERQPILPSSVEHSVNNFAIRLCGGALVALAISSWLSLLTWQARDAGQAAKATRNLLGSFGAGLSDMLVTTLGIAAVFAMLCPMVWGMELLANVRWISRFRLKVVAFVLSLLAVAGTASSLPALPGWPLLGGSGGMLGDLVSTLFSAGLQRNGVDRGNLTSALMLGLAGVVFLSAALGINPLRIVSYVARPKAVTEPPSLRPGAAAAAEPQPAPAPAPMPDAVPLMPAAAVASRATHAGPKPAQSQFDFDGQDDDADADASARAFAERFAPGVATDAAGQKTRLVPSLKIALARAREPAAWRRPSVNLLRRAAERGASPSIDVEAGAAHLVEVLAAFGVKGEIRQAASGPVITRYELEPARGTKISRVIGLADDFARELGVHAVRVSVTPGRTTIGIEVPNEMRSGVVLRDILESDAYSSNPSELPLALGKGISGEAVVLDLARMPHLLIAGTTGSGKSVGLNAMLVSLLYRHSPADMRLLLIDPKMLEMAQYDRIPHLLSPVITDPAEAARALEWAVAEMDERYKRMALAGARNIEGYNQRVRSALEKDRTLTRTVQTGFDPRTGRAVYEQQELTTEALPYIVIVIDELADLMLSAGKRIDASLQRLAQKARAAGIHLVMATQRPSVDVVTGTIKANFPVRISFRVASKIDSRTILNEAGAEQLLGHGDMLLTAGSGQLMRVHGAYVADEEIERVVEALRDQAEPDYVDLTPPQSETAPKAQRARSKPVQSPDAFREAARQDEIYAAAVAATVADRKASAGHLHRRLGVPMPEAEGLILRMEAEGLIGPPNMLGRRPIYIKAAAPARTARRAA